MYVPMYVSVYIYMYSHIYTYAHTHTQHACVPPHVHSCVQKEKNPKTWIPVICVVGAAFYRMFCAAFDRMFPNVLCTVASECTRRRFLKMKLRALVTSTVIWKWVTSTTTTTKGKLMLVHFYELLTSTFFYFFFENWQRRSYCRKLVTSANLLKLFTSINFSEICDVIHALGSSDS